MIINIYINGVNIKDIPEDELNIMKKTLTRTAMKAAGFVPVEEVRDAQKKEKVV